jgi:RNA polymerase sigma-70 factor (ECF subfamily)
MLDNTHDAEDIAQQALLKALTGIKQLRDDEQFGAWISRIAKNLCIDFIRQKKHQKNCVAEPAATSRRDPKEYPELRKALAKLSEDHRLALMLYYFDGRSAKSIGETFMISQAAAQTRISRARKQLRKLLEAEGGT